MKWAWRAVGSGFDLVLTESHGLGFKEVTFGYIVGNSLRAYDSWNGNRVGEYTSMIEAKRGLLEYTVAKINMAHESSKVIFRDGDVRG
jgi:hypothetical protein